VTAVVAAAAATTTAPEGAMVVAPAATTAPPLPGEPCEMMDALALMVVVAAVAASTTVATWEQASASTITPTATLLRDASRHDSLLREMGRPVTTTESVVTGGC
jgi:hypothetical protein